MEMPISKFQTPCIPSNVSICFYSVEILIQEMTKKYPKDRITVS